MILKKHILLTMNKLFLGKGCEVLSNKPFLFQTILRIRGMKGIDPYDDEYIDIHQDENKLTVKNPYMNQAQQYQFDDIILPESTQDETFKASTRNLIQTKIRPMIYLK